jgi:hypothetical protein
MKTMTCADLGGACDKKFKAETFEEMAKMSMSHGMEMAQARDQAHLDVMEKMGEKMSDPEAMQKWMEETHAKFDALPETS